MRLSTLLLAISIILLLAGPVGGQQRALFLLGSLDQNIDLLYNHNSQGYSTDSGSSSSSMDYFREQYNVNLGYAVYSPYLWKGNLLARLNLSQALYSADHGPSYDKSDVGLQYALDGLLLERQPLSLSFFTRAETVHVQRTFSPGYDVDTDNHGVALSLKNRFLPLTFTYSTNNSETSGLPNDTSLNNDIISLKGINSIRDISQTELELIRSHNVSDLLGQNPLHDESTLYSFSLRNQLWSTNKRHLLDSSLLRREEDHRGKNNSLYWREVLTSALGKALTLGATYSNNNSYIEYRNGSTFTRFDSKSQYGDINLTHRLFQSLVTQLSVSRNTSDFTNGTESTTAGKASFNYLKILPEQSSLNLYYSEALAVTDRDLTTANGVAVQEPLTVQLLGLNLLQHPQAVEESVIVTAADPAVRLTPYVRGVDYEIVRFGVYLRLDFNLAGSQIVDGAKLVVTYSYLVNPSSRYETSARSVGGTISLYDRRAVIYGSYSRTGQELLSGSADVVPLNSTTTIVGGVSSEMNGVFSNLEYDYIDSSFGTNQALQGLVRIDRDVRGYLVGFRLRDTWSEYGNGPGNPRERSENVFELGSTVRGALYNSILMTLGANYVNFTNDDLTRNDIRFDFNFRASYGRIAILLAGKLAWRFSDGTSADDQALTLQVTRFF